jgi:hypothetical protein
LSGFLLNKLNSNYQIISKRPLTKPPAELLNCTENFLTNRTFHVITDFDRNSCT